MTMTPQLAEALILGGLQIVDLVAVYLAHNPEAKPEFQALLDGYERAVAEGRSMTAAEVAEMARRRQALIERIHRAAGTPAP